MAGIPTFFQSISNVLPTYNYIDIASGTGFINFYAGKTVDSIMLSNYSYYSEPLITSTSFGTPLSKVLDIDFDILLNRPLLIAGKCVLNVPLGCVAVTSTCTIYVIAVLRKWNGVTETDLVTNQSADFGAVVGTTYNMSAIDLEVPITHFKIGETLRLTIEVWAVRNGAGASTVILAHDPMSRTTGFDSTGAVPSKLVLQLPVRLNL